MPGRLGDRRPLVEIRAEVRRHAPAHRLSADEELRRPDMAMLDGANDRAPERVFEHRRPIGRPAPFFHVGKVERHDRDAARCQAARVIGHERMKMARTGAVREHEEGVELAIALWHIQRGGDRCVGIFRKIEGDRTH